MSTTPLRRLSPTLARTLTLAALLAAARLPAQAPGPFRFAREDVLGSSSSLVVTAPDEAAAKQAETLVFAEVARLAGILSQWDKGSELAKLTEAGKGTGAPELVEVLQLADGWRTRTHGAFEPGVARLTKLWQDAEKAGVPPTDAELASAVKALHDPAFTVAGTAVTVKAPFSLDGCAKGWIVDAASRACSKVPGVELVSFQIGGDTRLGRAGSDIALTDPRQPAANGTPLLQLHVANAAVASSGSYARGFDIAGAHHSHILDPRTGKPADAVLGASVVAADVATADALATVLCVLGPTDGLRFLATVPGAEGVVVTKDGKVAQSPGLTKFVVPSPAAAPAAAGPFPAGFALQVEFTIQGPAAAESGQRRGGWRRPYVACWIEDVTDTPAKTLCLWVENLRWLRDLRRWSRQNPDSSRLVALVSQATRKAGNYTLHWDGTDDEGRALAPGRYTLYLEVVREHGSYQLIKKQIDIGTEPFTCELEGNEEVEKAKIVFGKVKKGS